MLKKLYLKILTSEFANNFNKLASGTLISQLILLLTAPFITRLYSPEDYGIFALFIAIVSIITPVASGRYDIAMVVVKENKEGDALFGLSLLVTFFTFLLLMPIFFIGEDVLKKFLNAEKLDVWWFLIPLAVVFQCFYILFKSYFNRYKNYSAISITSIIFSLLKVVFLISFGFLAFTSNGLFLAEIISTILIVILIVFFYRNFLGNISLIKTKELFILAKKYINFPIYQASSTIINSISAMLPIFFLTKYFTDTTVGYYALVLKIVFYPLSFISSSISMIHMKKTAELVHAQSDATSYLIKLTLILSAIISIPAAIIIPFGSVVFPFIFGAEWKQAGEFASLLMPGLMCIFIVSTLSPIFSSTGNLKISAVWNVTAFIINFILLFIFSPKLEINQLLVLISAINIFIYVFYFILIIYAIKNPKMIK
jgi:O-antigen/teichoic acid export membrane protein